jgi:hypothetical protein
LVRVWIRNFEFDNFSCSEIADGLRILTLGKTIFSTDEVTVCKNVSLPGARLSELFARKTGKDLPKIQLIELLVTQMFSEKSRRKLENRPIIRILERASRLAALNHFPIMQETWEKNQASKHFGKNVEHRLNRPLKALAEAALL